MSQPLIQFDHVSKEFSGDFWKKKIRALEDVTFEVRQGDIFGFVGPNGSGKTTSIKVLMGLIQPTTGHASILGKPPNDAAAKRTIGYLPENAYYYDYLRTEEVIDFYGRLFGLSRHERIKKTDELLQLVGLADRRGRKLRTFSKGMLQRIGIAQALVNDPEVVIFDEPMSGLDPIGRKEIRDIILRLRDEGKTILFSSHILPDIEAICDQVAIVVKGKVRASGAIEDLVRPKVKNIEVTYRGKIGEESLPWGERVVRRTTGDLVVLFLKDPSILEDVLAWARGKSLGLLSVIPHKEGLEDIFLEQVEAAR